MDVATDAPQGGDVSGIVSYKVPDNFQSSGEGLSDAAALARSLADQRYKAAAQAQRQDEQQAEPPSQAEPPQESAQADASPPEEVTGETQEADQEESLPPIEPPKSWTKDEKERWSTFPREAQEALARIEQGREREFLRRQNEAAEIRKAADAERELSAKARQDYESKLPALLNMLQSRGDFQDIKTLDDVKKLQAEDPFRFQAWQLHQMELQAVNTELQQAEQRKLQETQKQSIERKTREHQLLIEKAPEFADAKKLAEAQDAARSLFADKGFTDSDLAAIGDNPLLDDHRFQLIVNDALKYREAQAKAKAVAAKPLPPAQRPSTGKVDTGPAAQIQALNKQLDNATGQAALRIAAQIRRLQGAR